MIDSLELSQATILGHVISHPDDAGAIFARVRIEDFGGSYRHIAAAIHALRVAQKPIDGLAVIAQLEATGDLGKIGGPVEVWRVAGHNLDDPETSIDYLANVSRLRRLWALGVRAQQAVDDGAGDALAVARVLIEEAQHVVDGIEADGDVTTPTAGEFVATAEEPHDWIVPGLIERGDRLILTGTEGAGKSVLLRQIAVCVAAGLHPFGHTPTQAHRVLIVDCENGPRKVRRELRPLLKLASDAGAPADDNLLIECRPEGLDLTRPEDELWLTRHVSALQPTLLVTGPIYRLHNDDPNDERPARKVAAVLDRCRAVADCAVGTEAHAGHGWGGKERPVRPTGTSLWLRWPEFGYGLRPAEDYTKTNRLMDFVPWRGDREERSWPTQIQAGYPWPWQLVERPGSRWAPSGFERGAAS